MEVCGCFWECSTEGGRCFWGSFRDDGKKNQTYIFFSVQVYGRGCVIKVTVSRWNHPLHLQRWSWRPVSSLVVGILHSSPGPLGTRGLGPRLSPLFPVMLNWRLYSAITRIVMVSSYGDRRKVKPNKCIIIGNFVKWLTSKDWFGFNFLLFLIKLPDGNVKCYGDTLSWFSSRKSGSERSYKNTLK